MGVADEIYVNYCPPAETSAWPGLPDPVLMAPMLIFTFCRSAGRGAEQKALNISSSLVKSSSSASVSKVLKGQEIELF